MNNLQLIILICIETTNKANTVDVTDVRNRLRFSEWNPTPGRPTLVRHLTWLEKRGYVARDGLYKNRWYITQLGDQYVGEHK